jgi:uncharacterized damage-inducible protein DinB
MTPCEKVKHKMRFEIKPLVVTLFLATSGLTAAVAQTAQTVQPGQSSQSGQPAQSSQPAQPAPKTGVRAELLAEIAEAEQKVIDLANAFPADKYTWRPTDGVRSVSEVYMHIAGANFNIPQIAGVKKPANVPKEIEKVTDKAQVIDLLKQSFAHAREALINTPDSDLDKPVKLFGTDSTVRGVYLLIATHAHEHLGQSIAYARMNKIVPPWTAAAQAQQNRRP